MSTTKTVYELTFEHPGMVADQNRIADAYQSARDAAEGDSSDEEIDRLNELVDELMGYVGISANGIEVPECDECENEATHLYPKLEEPVQLCDSCEHNARRSGWVPGQ